MVNIGTILTILKMEDQMQPAIQHAVAGLSLMDQSTMASAGQIRTLGNQLQVTSRFFKELDVDATLTGKQLNALMGVSESSGYQLTLLGRGAREAGVFLSGITVVLGGAVHALIEFGSKFETEMMHVQTLAGTTKEEVDNIRQSVIDLGPVVGIGPAELAKGLFVLESYGLRGAAAMDTLKVAAEMSALGMGTVTEAARGVTGLLFSYQKQNLSAADAGNLLAKTAALGNVRISELVPAIARVNPVAAAMGIKFQDVAAALATFTHAGVDSSTAATGIRAMFGNILTDSAKTEKGFKELAVATGDASITMKQFRADVANQGWTATMVDLTNKANQYGEAGVAALTKIFPNIRALTEVLAVYSINGKMVTEINKKMNDSTDVLGEGMIALQKTWAWQWNAMKASIEKFWIGMGETLLPVFKIFLSFLRDHLIPMLEALAKCFNELPGPIQIVGLGFLALLAGLGPLLIVFGQIIMAVGNFQRGLPALTTAFSALSAQFSALSARSVIVSTSLTTINTTATRLGITLTGLKMAAIAVGVAFAAWEFGRWIANSNNLDERLARNAAKSQGWGDVDAETDLAKRAVMARAFSFEAYKIYNKMTYEDAVKFNQRMVEIGAKTANDWTTNAQGMIIHTKWLGSESIMNAVRIAMANKTIQDSIDALNDTQRTAILAGKAHGDSNKMIIETLQIMNQATGVTSEIISAFSSQQTHAASATKEFNKELASEQKIIDANNQIVELLAENGIDLAHSNALSNEEFVRMGLIFGATSHEIHTATAMTVGDIKRIQDSITDADVVSEKAGKNLIKSYNQIEVLMADTAAREIKADGETFAAKKAHVDEWATASIVSLNKMNLGTMDWALHLLAISKNVDAQKRVIDSDYVKQYKKETDHLNSIDGKWMEDNLALQEHYQSIVDKRFGDSASSRIKELQSQATKALAVNQKRLDDELAAIEKSETMGYLIKAYYAAKAEELANTTAEFIKKTLEEQTADIKFKNIVSKITGILDILGSVAEKSGHKTTAALIDIASTTATAFATGGPWAAAFAFATSVLSKFGDAILKTEGKAVNDLRDVYVAAAGGLDLLNRKAYEAGVSLNALLGASTNSAYEAAIKDLNAALEKQNELTKMMLTDAVTNTEALTKAEKEYIAELKNRGELLDEISTFTSAQYANITKGASGLVNAFATPWIMAMENASKYADETDSISSQILDLQAKIDDMNKKGGPATEQQARNYIKWNESVVTLTYDLQKLVSQHGIVDKSIQDFTKNGQNEFDRYGRIVATAFAASILGGKTFFQTLTDLQPSLVQLQTLVEKFGFKADSTLMTLLGWSKFAKDNPETVSALESLNQLMSGLSNIGMLNQSMFMDLGATAYDIFHKMELAGLGGVESMRAMQPTLQTIWQIQQDTGMVLDDNTQKLIDYAVEQGVVGEKFKTPAQKQVDALLGIQKVLGDLTKFFKEDFVTAILTSFGIISQSGVNLGKTIDAALQKSRVIPYTFELNGNTPVENLSSSSAQATGGYYPDFGTGTLALLPRQDRATAEQNGTSSGNQTIYIPVNLDGHVLTDVVIKNMGGRLSVVGGR